MKTARDALDQLTRDVLAAYHATDPSGAFEAIKAVLARSLPSPPGLDPVTVEACAREALKAVREMDRKSGIATVAHTIAARIRGLVATPEAAPPRETFDEALAKANAALEGMGTGRFNREPAEATPTGAPVCEHPAVFRKSRYLPVAGGRDVREDFCFACGEVLPRPATLPKGTP